MSNNITEDIEMDDNTAEGRITIEDINITMEMNMLLMAIQHQEDAEDDVPTHGYNLRKHPTNCMERVS